ncbi:MAG: mobile mystery protein A [Nitrospira sp.]|nr:mobile mystery protein A [Nitrospira sp.]
MRRDLARKHLDKRLAHWQPTSELACPPRGWIRAIREAIGMTTAQLAKRLNVSQPRVFALEKSEVSGALTLDTISRVAQALDCTFVYAIVPNTSLEDMVKQQAQKKVAARLARVDHTMKLEAQGLSDADLAAERERIVNELLKGNLRGLWDES